MKKGISMGLLLSFLFGIAFLFGAPAPKAFAAGTVYYVDPAGSDSNSGTSTSSPWKTLAKVNGTTFLPGDSILFKAGGVWNGQLYPKGSGTSGAGNTIKIDKYGTGSKPIINGQGNPTGAVSLTNQQYWEIRNLEVTNTGTQTGTQQYVGIRILNSTGGQLNHIYIGYCDVHSVNGVKSGVYGSNAGIAVLFSVQPANAKWDDVTIEYNNVYAIDRIGIYVGNLHDPAYTPNWKTIPRSSNILIQNNTVHDCAGDGILAFVSYMTTMQYNVLYDNGFRITDGSPNNTSWGNTAMAGMWAAADMYTTMQYNEVYNVITPGAGPG